MPSRLPVAEMRRVGDHAATYSRSSTLSFFTYMLPELKEEGEAGGRDEGLKAWEFIDRAVQKAVKA
jgi:hypothetical protein